MTIKKLLENAARKLGVTTAPDVKAETIRTLLGIVHILRHRNILVMDALEPVLAAPGSVTLTAEQVASIREECGGDEWPACLQSLREQEAFHVETWGVPDLAEWTTATE